MTATRAHRAAADRREEELRFLLASLDDLDREHAAGGLSEQRYEQLRAEYTARAADVARATARAREATRPPATARRDRRSRPAGGGSRLRRRLVAVAAAAALAGLGTEGTVTLLGGSPTDPAGSGPGSVAALQRVVRQNPRDAAAHDALANALARTGDLSGALREFDAAAALDPTDAVALAYSGWIAVLAGAPDKALPLLARAEAADPAFPDAHAFRGIALLRAGSDPAEARTELQRYLQLAPGGPMTQQVRDVLTQLDRQP